jgi:Holliday junction resolvase RusA-like endonuclease
VVTFDVTVSVPMQPVPKGRARHAVRRTPTGGVFVQTYTPDKTADYEALLGARVADAIMPYAPLDGALQLDVLFVLKRPSSGISKRLVDTVWHTKRPDRDNLEKAVMDALKHFWRDDAQVCVGRTAKVYAEPGGIPRVEIRIRPAPKRAPSCVRDLEDLR